VVDKKCNIWKRVRQEKQDSELNWRKTTKSNSNERKLRRSEIENGKPGNTEAERKKERTGVQNGRQNDGTEIQKIVLIPIFQELSKQRNAEAR